MKFYDIQDSIIEKDGYILKFTSKGKVGPAMQKNRFTANVPDNDFQIQRNLDTMLRLMVEKDDVYADMMVTCTRIGEPQKALLIEISKVSAKHGEKQEEKQIEELPARRGRKPANLTGEGTGDSNGQDR